MSSLHKQKTILPHSWPMIDGEDLQAITKCIEDEFVGFNPELESKISLEIQKYIAMPEISTTPSGSLALLLSLKEIGVGAGDEVIISSINCWSAYHMIKFLNATPVICDIRSTKDFRASYETIKTKIAKNTKAIIITHMFGVLVEAESIKKLKEEGIPLIEDYASSFGGQFANSDKIGQHSDYVIGSFGSTKPVPGGCCGFLASKQKIVTDNYADYSTIGIPFNIHISSLSQQLIITQLGKLKTLLKEKEKLIEFYQKFIKIENSNTPGLFRAITFDKIDELIQFLAKHGLEMDARSSVQPNLAKTLNLPIKNAIEVEPYYSLPYNFKTLQILRNKDLL